ncbi:GAF and ANTAR domain-containing protein [Streptomyces sp. NPDC050504]|uniref:GAF and ANTAR domain-containing protein n=1 Tax=Streptomyces sp. NPDC050504 TaxID=3365618 RepID=UPI00379D7555
MDNPLREQQLASVFAELADTLVDDFDVIEFLQRTAARCVELLDVRAAGLMLLNQRGRLQTAASSDERAWLLGVLDAQHAEGPCLDCCRTGAPVGPIALDSAEAAARWPAFTAHARAAGFVNTFAVPMRMRENPIGALNVFLNADQHPPDPADVRLTQAFADTATIGILQQRTVQHGEFLLGQLQSAVTSRVRVEQAKGILAERWGISVDAAYEELHDYAAAHRAPLSQVALALVRGELDAEALRAAGDEERD